MLPGLSGDAPAKPEAPKTAYPDQGMEMMTQKQEPRGLNRYEVMDMIQAEKMAPPPSGPSPAEAAHATVQMMIDHPAQQAALAPVVSALTAEAAKKP